MLRGTVKLCSEIAVSKIRNGKEFLLNCAGTARKDQQRREADEKRQKQFAKLCQDDAQINTAKHLFSGDVDAVKGEKAQPHSLRFL